MAIDLVISLTDTEQAVVRAVALRVNPGATAPQIKAWAEKLCKAELRKEVLRLKRQSDEDADRAAEIARRNEQQRDKDAAAALAASRTAADLANFPKVV